MRENVLSVLALMVCLVGCIPEPIVYRIRLEPQIAAAQDRILSFELVGPAAWSRQRVVCYGVFTPRYLEQSNDAVEDFELGWAYPGEWKHGRVSLALQESGVTRLIPLERPSAPKLGHVYRLRVDVPLALDDVHAHWVDE